MKEHLEMVFNPRLSNIDSNSIINIDWLCNLYRIETGHSISSDDVISYLKYKGFTKYKFKSRSITNSPEADKSPSDDVVTHSDDPHNNQIKNSNSNKTLATFNPNDFLDQLDVNTIDISNITFNDNEFLFEKIKFEENKQVLNLIVTTNLKLVEKIAQKYMGIGHKLEFEDLVNTGVIGLMKAIERYDLTLNTKFSTYATPWIRQAITRYINDNGYTIRLPVHIHESLNKLRKIERNALNMNGQIDIEYVTKEMDITLEKYYKLKNIEYSFSNISSLNLIVSDENDDTDLLDLINPSIDMEYNINIQKFKNPLEHTIDKDVNNTLRKFISELPNREADIIRKRMGFIDGVPKTLEDIGEDYSVTRERIRQIEKKALEKLRKLLLYHKIDQRDLTL